MTFDTVCFSGHRILSFLDDERLKKLELDLSREIERAIHEGFNTFMFGACYGFDFLAAEQVVLQKHRICSNESKIKLVAVIPFTEQAKRWNQITQNQYYALLKQSDEIITLHSGYSSKYYLERNRYMVDRSQRLICYYNGSSGGTCYTVKYAKSLGIEIVNLYK